MLIFYAYYISNLKNYLLFYVYFEYPFKFVTSEDAIVLGETYVTY